MFRFHAIDIKEALLSSMNDEHKTLDCFQTLDLYKIKPTSIRVDVLKIIYTTTPKFTIDTITDLLIKGGRSAKRNSVAAILRLYQRRGLLKKVSPEKPPKTRGQPLTWFTLIDGIP